MLQQPKAGTDQDFPGRRHDLNILDIVREERAVVRRKLENLLSTLIIDQEEAVVGAYPFAVGAIDFDGSHILAFKEALVFKYRTRSIRILRTKGIKGIEEYDYSVRRTDPDVAIKILGNSIDSGRINNYVTCNNHNHGLLAIGVYKPPTTMG